MTFEEFGQLLEQSYQSKAGLLNFLHQNADTEDPILEDELMSAAICIEEQRMTDDQCVDFMRNHFSGDWDGFLYEVVNYIDEYVLDYI